MVEEVKKRRARIAEDWTKGAKLVATAYYANIEGKDFASVLFNGEVVFTTDKEGNKLNLLGDVLSKEQIESENARTAKLDRYLANKKEKEGDSKQITESFCEIVKVDKAKIHNLDKAPVAKEILMHTAESRTA